MASEATPPEIGDGELSEEEAVDLHVEIGRAFSPGAPVSTRDLFAGRTRQLSDLLSVTGQRGAHAIVYGERGVGKTSLASVVAALLVSRGTIAARTNCDGGDDFSSIWRKALAGIQVVDERMPPGFAARVEEVATNAAAALPDQEVSSHDVQRVLKAIAAVGEPVVVIDEFDRVEDRNTGILFADTIKALSDHAVPATIVLVGVADTVDELIEAHGSVERALAQILMPRMSPAELTEIAQRGLGTVGMTIQDDALQAITGLSQGLPHYTHLLTQQAALAAVGQHQTRNVSRSHVRTAIGRAIDRGQRSLKDAYHKATASPRETLYPQVLLASALAQGDDLGYFAPADVRAPLSEIMGKSYDIPSFIQHLHALSEIERGPVLQKRGQARRYRFRFINPMLQPYVIMHGIEEGVLPPNALGI